MQELGSFVLSSFTLSCLCSLTALGIGVFFVVFPKLRPNQWIKFKNKFNRNFGRIEWVVPPNLGWQEQKIVENAHKLSFLEVPEALKKAPLNSTKKSLIQQQADKIPENIINLMEKLGQVRRLKETISRIDRYGNSNQNLGDIQQIEKDIMVEVNYSMEILSSIPISLVRLEISRGDNAIENMLLKLDEANTRMVNLTSTYKDEKKEKRGW